LRYDPARHSKEAELPMGRIKVLQIIEATTGGTWKHVMQLLRGLDSERFELCLAASFRRSPETAERRREAAAKHARVLEIPMHRRPAPLADLVALRALMRLVREFRPDIVHTHASKAGFLGRLAAHRAGVSAILHSPHTFPFQRVDTRLTAVYRWLERRAGRWCHRLVCLTDGQRQLALQAGLCCEEKLVVIPHGITPLEQGPDALRQRYRQELGLDPQTPALGFIGRIAAQKDIQTLLDAARRLFHAQPGTRLFLVGQADEGPYLRSLRPPIGENARQVVTGSTAVEPGTAWSADLPVEVLGPRGDAARLVAAFDALLLPSRYEGLPYVLLEAMGNAVPAVASDTPAHRDAVRHGVDGLLVPPGDASAFAEALRGLLAQPDVARQLGLAARQTVLERFTEERFIAAMEDFYTKMLRDRKADA
jgi:glycosyltransferase involved in cell wall biosynthesis